MSEPKKDIFVNSMKEFLAARSDPKNKDVTILISEEYNNEGYKIIGIPVKGFDYTDDDLQKARNEKK